MRYLLCALFAILATPASAIPLLHGLFQDHAVLQRDRPIAIWGRATANAAVTVSLGPASATVHAGVDGRWSAALPAMPAGGPYTLEAVSGDADQVVRDVLIGDVWLCSGQSNVVLPVNRTLDSRSEIANAANDTIRMLTVPASAGAAPLTTFATSPPWLVAGSDTVSDFSATCFYFARELQKSVRVPMGLVVSAWGGAKIQSWMSPAALHAAGGYDSGIDIVKQYASDPLVAAQHWGAVWETWWKGKLTGPEPWREAFDDRAWPVAPAALGYWDNWGVPELVNRTGLVWYRTTLALTAAQAAQARTLAIGNVDEIGLVWIDGQFVGDGMASERGRVVTLPAGLLHAGENSIAVSILNTYKLGGLTGPASVQALNLEGGGVVPLTAPWRYFVVPKGVGDPPRAPWEPLGGLGMAYNGMIAPLGAYGFRGALWYQGESNTGEPDRYGALLTGLMADWRSTFGDALPFLIVQLPGFGPPSSVPIESGIAELREAQRHAVLADPHAGLAVTIDIGERSDVHPANKQELGRRLAQLARHVVYGESVVPSGPVVRGARREKNRVTVAFSDVVGTLVAYSADAPIGFELCGAARASCRFATAHIAGSTVSLAVAKGTAPTRVRFCWGESPVCTLYDRSGVPAGPFEIPIPLVRPAAKPVRPLYKKR